METTTGAETATVGERYGFELRGIDTADRTERLGLIEVDVVGAGAFDELRTQLRPWALAMLDALGGGFDRYHAVFVTLDADGEPAHQIDEERIAGADGPGWGDGRFR